MPEASPHTLRFLSLLDGVKKTAAGWDARCPCRQDDNNPSMSVAESADGKILVHCHRGGGCDSDAICSAVGLTQSDLYPPKDKSSLEQFVNSPQKYSSEKLKFVKAYDYLDEDGNFLFQKVRFLDENGKKTFRQRKKNSKGEWEYSLGNLPKVLYNLPLIKKARENNHPVWLVEGEKDADTLTDMGIIATTMPGGAGKWLDINTESLAGLQVEIIADNDDPGKKHALKVYEELSSAGCDVQVWICPEHKDITDHLTSGKKIDELIEFDVDEFSKKENQEPGEIDVHVVDEERPKADVILEKVIKLMEREDLSSSQLLAKAQSLIQSFSHDEPLDKGRIALWEEFLNEEVDDSYDWVIEGLLERAERVIVVAAEGVGKTMLARQVALCAGYGIHPFTFQPMPKVKTLTVDLENPERIIRRTSRKIQIQAHHQAQSNLNAKFRNGPAPTARSESVIFTKPSGLDLMKPYDRMLLEEKMDEVRPEMLVMGPLYKSFVDPGGRTSESIAVEVAKYLDALRTTYNCALWLEHHAPLGQSMSTRDLRPFGSAVWSRWPEFGISLQPDLTSTTPYVYDVRHFRGARDERQWPTKIKRGKRFPFEVLEFNGHSSPANTNYA